MVRQVSSRWGANIAASCTWSRWSVLYTPSGFVGLWMKFGRHLPLTPYLRAQFDHSIVVETQANWQANYGPEGFGKWSKLEKWTAPPLETGSGGMLGAVLFQRQYGVWANHLENLSKKDKITCPPYTCWLKCPQVCGVDPHQHQRQAQSEKREVGGWKEKN